MKISRKIQAVGLVPLFLLTIAIVLCGISMQKSQILVAEYIAGFVDRQVAISEIYEQLGYGKGIHAFKNYVLRGRPVYLEEARRDLTNALGLIGGYEERFELAEEEAKAMQDLQDTIQLYVAKIDVAESLVKKNKPPQVIDKAVKVDDTAAVASLNRLQVFLKKKYDAELKQLKSSQKTAFLLVIISFILAAVVGLLISRYLSRSILKSIEHLRQISTDISEGDYKIGADALSGMPDDEFQELLDQMTKMSQSLDATFTKLKVSNEDLEQFAYIASHDLQEPIKIISAFADFLEIDCGESLSKEGKEHLKKIKDSSIRMKKLIEALLDYSTLTSGEVNLAEVNLNEVVEESLKNLELEIKDNKTIVEVGELPHVRGNRFMLQSLFQNLILNSIKFRKKDTRNQIKIQAQRKEPSLWHLSVSDNGIGFDTKHTEKILKPLGRLHGKSKYSGSGIGLAACNRILTAHESKFIIESEIDKGSVFSFDLREV